MKIDSTFREKKIILRVIEPPEQFKKELLELILKYKVTEGATEYSTTNEGIPDELKDIAGFILTI